MNLSAESRVAILFHRIGPYHHARLEAASKQLRIAAIQGCSRDRTYDWVELGHEGAYPLETLFPNGDSDDQPPARVRQQVAEALNRLAPAVVVVPGWAGNLALAALGWCAVNWCPAVVMSESQAIDEPRSPGKEFIKRQVVGCFSSALVGGTPHADYLTKLGMSRNRIFPGYDAVDNDYFAAKAGESRNQKIENRNRIGLSEKYFLASARFVEKKNLPRLLEAYARYHALSADHGRRTTDHRPWDLVLLGDGPLREILNSQLSTLNMPGRVLMPGFKQYPELPTYYGLASAFVHASTTEQWGLVVNEAMASGLPVLVSNRCGCAPALVRDGVNGFTFDPCNIEEMANAMMRVASLEQGARSKMGDAGRAIIANWGPERFASGLRAAVDKALEIGPIKPSLLQRPILQLLSRR